MERDSKILVLGHRGMVGSSIIRSLKRKGYENIKVGIFDCTGGGTRDRLDLTNQRLTNEFFDFISPDYVFLAAAQVGGIYANLTYPAKFIYNNLEIQNNVIESCRISKVKKLLFLGSSCIYPREAPQPLKEEYLLSGPLETTNEYYAIAKIAGIKMCEAYWKEYGCRFISCQPCNLYGTCFSGDTEVLTVSGIKNIKDVNVGDAVYTLNPETHDIEVENVVATQRNKTKEFFNFKGRSVDFKVTSDHKLYCKTSGNFVKKKAEYFRDRIGRRYGQITFAHHNIFDAECNIAEIDIIKYADQHHIIKGDYICDGITSKEYNNITPSKYKAEDFFEFMGWYISEGSVSTNTLKKNTSLKRGQIRISQSKKCNLENYSKINKLMSKMNLSFGKDDYSFYLSSRLFINFIEKEIGFGSDCKRIPKFVFGDNVDNSLRQILFDAMMSGDGNKTGRRYQTKSNELKNDFIHLCFLLGIKIGKVSRDGNCWRLNIRKDRKNATVKYSNITLEKTDNESTFCFTTEKNHIIYAGRGGCFNWIGQCDNYDPMNSHVIPAMIRRFVEAKQKGDKEVVIWGNGAPLREFLFVDDLSDACVHLMERYEDRELINIGSGREISIKDLSFLIKKVTGFDGSISFDLEKPNGTPRKIMDSSKIFNMGWIPKISLEEGLGISYKDFLKNNLKENKK